MFSNFWNCKIRFFKAHFGAKNAFWFFSSFSVVSTLIFANISENESTPNYAQCVRFHENLETAGISCCFLTASELFQFWAVWTLRMISGYTILAFHIRYDGVHLYIDDPHLVLVRKYGDRDHHEGWRVARDSFLTRGEMFDLILICSHDGR